MLYRRAMPSDFLQELCKRSLPAAAYVTMAHVPACRLSMYIYSFFIKKAPALSFYQHVELNTGHHRVKMAPAVLLSSTLSSGHTQAFGQNVKPLRSQSRGLGAIQCKERISEELVEVARDKSFFHIYLGTCRYKQRIIHVSYTCLVQYISKSTSFNRREAFLSAAIVTAGLFLSDLSGLPASAADIKTVCMHGHRCIMDADHDPPPHITDTRAHYCQRR